MANGGGYNFEQALAWLRGGRKIKRIGWNGHGMFIFLNRELITQVGVHRETEPLIGIYAEGTAITVADRIDMRYADGKIGVWTATHEDILAGDWLLLM